MGAPSKKRLVLLHAWPDGDFFENTRGSQRVNLVQRIEDGIRDIRPESEAALFILKRHGKTWSVPLKSPCMEQTKILSKNFDLLRVSLVFCPNSCVTSDK